MPAIGVRDLHTRTAEVLRHVRESGAEYVVTLPPALPTCRPEQALELLEEV